MTSGKLWLIANTKVIQRNPISLISDRKVSPDSGLVLPQQPLCE